MNPVRLLLAASAAFLVSSSFSMLWAANALGDKDFPKHFHWQREVNGETVVMDIDAAYFVEANHKVRREGGIIDGYGAQPVYLPGSGSRFPFFTINNWKIRWGRKRLHLFPRGAYTSVFTPHLCVEGRPGIDRVEVVVCDGGDALMVTMLIGNDAVTGTVSFVITKDGRIRRFITGVYSLNGPPHTPNHRIQATAFASVATSTLDSATPDA